jgi:hypothetical protein
MVTGVGLAACVPVDGGAVELAWSVRDSSGRSASCARSSTSPAFTDDLATVSLCARACTVIADGECVGEETCPIASWDCERGRGTTRFEVTAGRKELWIEVACADGTPADVLLPEPVVREIADGEVTQLNAILITVPASAAACSSI